MFFSLVHSGVSLCGALNRSMMIHVYSTSFEFLIWPPGDGSWLSRFMAFPSLLQFHQSLGLSPSVTMELLCVIGALLSLLMMVFRAMRCSLLFATLFILYLSVYKVYNAATFICFVLIFSVYCTYILLCMLYFVLLYFTLVTFKLTDVRFFFIIMCCRWVKCSFGSSGKCYACVWVSVGNQLSWYVIGYMVVPSM